MELRAHAWVVAVAVAGLLAGAGGVVTGRSLGGVDSGPFEWASSVDALCVDAAGDLVEIGAAPSLEPDELRPWAGEVAGTLESLSEAVRGSGGYGAGEVADAFAERSGLYRQMASPDGELPRADGTDPYNAKLAKLDVRVRTVLEPLGSTSCAKLGQPGSVARVRDEYPRWISALDEACLQTLGPLGELDDQLGSGAIDAAEFDRRSSEAVAALAGALEGTPPPSVKGVPRGVSERWTALVDAVRGTGEALAAGDRELSVERSGQWARAGEALGLGACARGVPAGTTTPSGAVALPELPAYGGGGIAGGAVTDAESVLRFATDASLPAAGVDPSDAFNLPAVITALFDGQLRVVAGDQVADATSVSVSAAAPADGSGPAGDGNVYVIGVAVADTSGRCTLGVSFGHPRLSGTAWAPGDGPCTGDRARQWYLAGGMGGAS